ncbi:MAG TPA: sialidase family protein, partial [Flavisolibacter sp.]
MKTIYGIIALSAVLAVTVYTCGPRDAVLTPAEAERYRRKQEKAARAASYFEARAQYEREMLKDPATGTIPRGIMQQEVAFARTIAVRNRSTGVQGQGKVLLQNTYIPAGPNNIGGRTRALAFDVRYNGSSNRVIIAGCVSGGTMRSADGGITWTLVTPPNEIHNLTALVQDPRPGFQDQWYAGGGEFVGNSASEVGAPYLGFGIWKSVDNGLTWNKLTNSITELNGSVIGEGQLAAFDHPFDIVHRMVMNPVNGHLFIAGHRRLVRSTDGGASFQVVFGSNAAANSATGQMDIAMTQTGRLYLAVNGAIPDPSARGIWISSTGNAGSFTRIAGGQTVGVDSVQGWRGNAYTGGTRRILITLAPSDQNIGYVFYENGLTSDPPELKPEADLFRFTSSGSSFTWSNRSANMPDFPGGNLAGSDPLSVQGGYDMMVRVKPDDPNTVFIGGTNLYRSTDGFSTTSTTAWIGGYRTDFTYRLYPNSHADIHDLVFNPVNPNHAICANDGGIQHTTSISASPVSWTFPANYQSLQYYHVAMDPDPGRNNFAGGSQDNGVRLRDRMGIFGQPAADSNNHVLLFSADGGHVG